MYIRITKRRSRNATSQITLRMDENQASLLLVYAMDGIRAHLATRAPGSIMHESESALLGQIERAETLLSDSFSFTHGVEADL